MTWKIMTDGWCEHCSHIECENSLIYDNDGTYWCEDCARDFDDFVEPDKKLITELTQKNIDYHQKRFDYWIERREQNKK